jgi:hypothetical protein
MAELVLSVDVAASAEQAWAALTDWASQGAWMFATGVEVTGGDGASVGSLLSARTGVGPLAFVDDMEITHWDPPRRCEVRHFGRVVRGAGAFEVEPRGRGQCRVVWSEWLELPGGLAGQYGFALAKPLIQAPVALSLRRLARQTAAGGG